MLCRSILIDALLAIAMAGAATAQPFPQHSIQLQLQYREPVPAGADPSSVHLKIYSEIRRDCETAAKAFDRECRINQINISEMPLYQNGSMSENRVFSGSANLSLIEPPATATAPSSSPK